MKLVVAPLTRPVAWDGSAAAGATRPPRSALREQIPIAVSELADQYLMRLTRESSSSPSHPRTPWVLPRWLQGRLARSTAVRFFAVLSRARALRAITQSAPARPRTQEHRETNRCHQLAGRDHGDRHDKGIVGIAPAVRECGARGQAPLLCTKPALLRDLRGVGCRAASDLTFAHN